MCLTEAFFSLTWHTLCFLCNQTCQNAILFKKSISKLNCLQKQNRKSQRKGKEVGVRDKKREGQREGRGGEIRQREGKREGEGEEGERGGENRIGGWAR